MGRPAEREGAVVGGPMRVVSLSGLSRVPRVESKEFFRGCLVAAQMGVGLVSSEGRGEGAEREGRRWIGLQKKEV